MTAPTGGTITTATVGGTLYRVHTFTAAGDFVVPSGMTLSVEHLIVGGGGGTQVPSLTTVLGGGGAGGLLQNVGSPSSRTAGTYPVVVGLGGTGSPGVNPADQREGFSSTVFGLESFGGGAPRGINASSGGSGGGGGVSGTTLGTAGAGTAGQGSDGRVGVVQGNVRISGPGGGASGDFAVMGDLDNAYFRGGTGIQVNIDGDERYFAGGGTGGVIGRSDLPGQGLENPGGGGGVNQPGVDGLGGGAGGGGFDGGDGIVILRYPFAEAFPDLDLALTAQETTLDTFAALIRPQVQFSYAVQEQYGPDTFAGEIANIVSISFTAQEATQDAFAAELTSPISYTLTVQEQTSDTFAAAMIRELRIDLAAQEQTQDTFAASAGVSISYALAAQEVGQDTFAAAMLRELRVAITAQETTLDTFASQIAVGNVIGAITAQEVGQDTFAVLARGRQYTVALEGTFRRDTATAGAWRGDQITTGNWRGATQISGTWRRANVGENV